MQLHCKICNSVADVPQNYLSHAYQVNYFMQCACGCYMYLTDSQSDSQVKIQPKMISIKWK